MIVAAVFKRNRLFIPAIALMFFAWMIATAVASQHPKPKKQEQPKNSTGRTPEEKAVNAARASELLKRARLASGLESASGSVQTLSFSAKSERFAKYISVQSPSKVVEKEKKLGGKIEAECWLPDKFRLKKKGSTLTGFGFSYTEIINGEQAWRDPPMTVRSFGRDSRVIDVGDVERTLLMQERTAKQQIAYYSLGWLLQAPASLQVELSYAGVYDLDGKSADVVIADGQDGFRILLMFDPQTHLLAALGTGFFDAYRETVIVEVSSLDARFTRASYARAREERRLRTQPPKAHEVLWQFSDYRQVSGVMLPHRTTIKFDGRPVEELTISEFKVNQPTNPKRFDGKPEVKYDAPR